MKAIKKLFISLVVIVAVLGVVVIGGYIYVRSAYGIDLFRTAGQLKTLSQTPDESVLCPNAFSASDMADVKSNMDDYAVYGKYRFFVKTGRCARADDFLRANRRKSENRRKGIARKTRSNRLFEYCGKR